MSFEGKAAFKATLLTILVVAALALLFGMIADACYDGPLAAPSPEGAPRNFLNFRSGDVYGSAVVLSVMVTVHWLPLAWKSRNSSGNWPANAAYALAVLLLPLLWTDSILDDYYRISVFCPGGGERVNAIDVSWGCVTAYHARTAIIPLAIPVLIVISFILRLWPRPTSSKSDPA